MSGKHILAFEADPVYANMLSESLGNDGYLTDIVSEGVEGLDKAAAEPPDLIYLCVELPRISGFSICNKIKKNQVLKNIPLIITSSEASEETFEKHKRLKGRADEYLHKPFTADQIVASIQSLLENGGALREAPVQEDSLDELDEIVVEEEIIIEDDSVLLDSDVDLEDVGELEELEEIDATDGVEIIDEEKSVDSDVSAFTDRAFDAATLESDAPDAKAEVPPVDSSEALSAAQLDRLKSKNEELVKKVDSLEKQLIAAKSAKKSGVSSSEFLDLREALNNKDRELLDLKDTVNSKEKEILDLRDKLNGLERQKADLEDKNIEVHKQLNQVEQQLDELSVEHEHLSSKSAEQGQYIASLEQTEVALRAELAAEKAGRDEDVRREKEAAARILEEQAAEKQAAYDEAVSKLNEQKAQELAALQRAHETEVESLNTAHVERENDLSAQLEGAQATLDETKEALEAERKELAETQEKLAEQTARGDGLDKTVEELNAEVKELTSLILRNEEICNKAQKAVAIAAQLLESIETVEDDGADEDAEEDDADEEYVEEDASEEDDTEE